MAELPPGQILGGKYTLQALLRRAPWGSTHRAITSPNREVVIKVLDASLAGRPEVLEAIRKAEAAGVAMPPHLALRVVEQGIDAAAGVPYIVTPTAATPSLEQLVALCALSPAETVSFVQNLGHALDALHFAGYKHLALKPSNVFVGPTPECAVQLADFGANAVRAMMDRDAQLACEAPWLAPEQIEGDEKAGTEADVFAAALVTFFAMTGRSLWRSCRATAVDVAAWRAEIAGAAPRASEAASEVGAVIDPAFDDAFARALAKPETRTKSVSVFAQELAEALGSVQPAPSAIASNAVATAISLPPDAIEAEPADASPSHTPPRTRTLSPPAGQSLPPAPERAVAAPAAAGVAGAVPAPSHHPIARPHTMPYWNEVASQPAEHDPFPPPPAPALSIPAPLGVPVQAAPASASVSASPTVPPRAPGLRWIAVAAGVALGVVVGVLAFGRARGFSFGRTPATASSTAEPAPPTGAARPGAAVSAGPAESAAPTAVGSAGPAPAESAPPADSAMPPMVVAPARPDDAQLTVICEPACDLVAIDSRRMVDYPEPVRLRPGVHGVGASRAHYGGQWKQVNLRAGEKATVTFALSPSSGSKKPCGQFLKRCRD